MSVTPKTKTTQRPGGPDKNQSRPHRQPHPEDTDNPAGSGVITDQAAAGLAQAAGPEEETRPGPGEPTVEELAGQLNREVAHLFNSFDLAGGSYADCLDIQRGLINLFTLPENQPYLRLIPREELEPIRQRAYEFLLRSGIAISNRFAAEMDLPLLVSLDGEEEDDASQGQAAGEAAPEAPTVELPAPAPAAEVRRAGDLTGGGRLVGSGGVVLKQPERWTRALVLALAGEETAPNEYGLTSKKDQKARPLYENRLAVEAVNLLGRYGPMTSLQLRTALLAADAGSTGLESGGNDLSMRNKKPNNAPQAGRQALSGLRTRLYEALYFAAYKQMVKSRNVQSWEAGRPAAKLWLLAKPGEIWYQVLTGEEGTPGATPADTQLLAHIFGIQQVLTGLRGLANRLNGLRTLDRLADRVLLSGTHPAAVYYQDANQPAAAAAAAAAVELEAFLQQLIHHQQQQQLQTWGEQYDTDNKITTKGLGIPPAATTTATIEEIPALALPSADGAELRLKAGPPAYSTAPTGGMWLDERRRLFSKPVGGPDREYFSRAGQTPMHGCQVELAPWATALPINRNGITRLIPDAIGRLVVDDPYGLLEPTLLTWANLEPDLLVNQFHRHNGRLVWPFFLEYDRNTEAAEDFGEKYLKYLELYNSLRSAWPIEWGEKFPVVLVVVEGGPRRLANIREAIINQVRHQDKSKQVAAGWWFTCVSWFNGAYRPYLSEQAVEAWERYLCPDLFKFGRQGRGRADGQPASSSANSSNNDKPPVTEPAPGANPRIWLPLGVSAEPYQLAALHNYLSGNNNSSAAFAAENDEEGEQSGELQQPPAPGVPPLVSGLAAKLVSLPLPHPLNLQSR